MVGNLDKAETDKMRMLKNISGEKKSPLPSKKYIICSKRQAPKNQKCFLCLLISSLNKLEKS